MIIAVLLLLLASVTLAAVIPGFRVATTAVNGEQAAAQANAGLSDALFRLDQMGDNVTDFCIGDPPANLIPTGLSCMVSGPSPLPSAPALQYEVAADVPAPLPPGVVNEVVITSHAADGNQQRTVTSTVYRVADGFGLFGVSGLDSRGALSQSNVFEVGGYPVSGPLVGGTVDVGVGPSGNATCTGSSSGTSIVTIGQQGATSPSSSQCPKWTQEPTSFEPLPPTICSGGQISTAFAPCVTTSVFATYGASDITYCPLPGSGIPNTLSPTTKITLPSQNAVFDCTTPTGAPITVTTKATLPFGLSQIPAGTYYFNSNATTIGNINPALLAGATNMFILPSACGSDACPQYAPTSGSNQVETGGGCNLPPNANTNVSLALGSSAYINSLSSSSAGWPHQPKPYFIPGDPANLTVYWSGNNQIITKGANVFDGELYAPGAIVINDGNTGPQIFGSMILNCFQEHGGPNLYLVYPQHPRQFLLGWSVTNYSITP
ncbi:MAG: hypothetical protein ACYCVV_14315 [Acidimicrobiales bacterium]